MSSRHELQKHSAHKPLSLVLIYHLQIVYPFLHYACKINNANICIIDEFITFFVIKLINNYKLSSPYLGGEDSFGPQTEEDNFSLYDQSECVHMYVRSYVCSYVRDSFMWLWKSKNAQLRTYVNVTWTLLAALMYIFRNFKSTYRGFHYLKSRFSLLVLTSTERKIKIFEKLINHWETVC